ncbi:type II secretion system minor pseudopilin GspK [Geoalkalibacter halelectricus]|uniref:type II secretion system minor pseudopilin GspK n=1 Tax=Geoalkalibacter halelectricus TaxID=2847045 RepID=UPI00267017C7|nr:type II secretion system minor pseudopilin GspK [Geoalkalibacter halelectricus]MDO3379663.1 type II secretion system minor pseudopilin GspK [Geoalkalibacter halelectricus]
MKKPLLRQEKGMVLLLVLVVTALLSALLTEFAFSTLVDLRLVETYRDSTRSYYLARGGIRAGQMILREDQNHYDARNELWGQGVANFPVGDDGVITIDIEDLDGRLALNALVRGNNPEPVQRERLTRLFEHFDFDHPADMVAALIDWLDSDSEVYDQDGALGAESSYYLSLNPPYNARNGPMISLDELALVRGFTPEIVDQLRPHVSIYGGLRVNLNTATPEVIATLYFDDDRRIYLEEAEAIVAVRDLTPFETLADFQREFPGLWELFPTSSELTYSITFRSNYYRIRSQAWVNDGTRTVTAVVSKGDNKIHSLRVD